MSGSRGTINTLFTLISSLSSPPFLSRPPLFSLSLLSPQFFERLELFAEESIRKHNELTERIRKEVTQSVNSTAHLVYENVRLEFNT